MNVQIDIALNYEGPGEGLNPLIDSLGDALAEHGFGSDADMNEDGVVPSMMVVKLRELVSDEDIREYMQDSFIMALPMNKEENSGDTGDQREASGEGERVRSGEDRAAELQ